MSAEQPAGVVGELAAVLSEFLCWLSDDRDAFVDDYGDDESEAEVVEAYDALIARARAALEKAGEL